MAKMGGCRFNDLQGWHPRLVSSWDEGRRFRMERDVPLWSSAKVTDTSD